MVRLETEIEKIPGLIGVCYRIAAEDIVLQNAGEGPVSAPVSGISPACLPKVGCIAVKLPPTDCDPGAISDVQANRWLVSRVTDDVVPIGIDIHLVAGKEAVLGDHSRRTLQPIKARGRRRHLVLFQRLGHAPTNAWRRLPRSGGERGQRPEKDT